MPRIVPAAVMVMLAARSGRQRGIDVDRRMELMARPHSAETRIVDHVRPGRHEYTAHSCDHNDGWYEVSRSRASPAPIDYSLGRA